MKSLTLFVLLNVLLNQSTAGPAAEALDIQKYSEYSGNYLLIDLDGREPLRAPTLSLSCGINWDRKVGIACYMDFYFINLISGRFVLKDGQWSVVGRIRSTGMIYKGPNWRQLMKLEYEAENIFRNVVKIEKKGQEIKFRTKNGDQLKFVR